MDKLEELVCNTPYINRATANRITSARVKADAEMLRAHIDQEQVKALRDMADSLARTRGETYADISRRLTKQARKREEERLFEGTDAVTGFLKFLNSDPKTTFINQFKPQQLERVMPSRVNRTNYDVNPIFDRAEAVLTNAVGDLSYVLGDMVEADNVEYIQVEAVQDTLNRLIEVVRQFVAQEHVFSTQRPNTLTVGDDGVVVDRYGARLGVLAPTDEEGD